MIIKDNHSFIRNPAITSSRLDDETVLLNIETGDYYTTNNTGSIIWDLVDVKRTVIDLVNELSRRFDTPEVQIKEDVIKLLQDFVREQLIILSEVA